MSNNNSRNYIEKRLDEDRECGEWENFQKIKGRNALVANCEKKDYRAFEG